MNGTRAMWFGSTGLALGLICVAFVAASMLQDTGILSLTPPATWDNVNPLPDVEAGNTLALYQSAFTAWVALILLVPVFGFVWFAGRSETDYVAWLSFWTVSYVAYLIHLFVSMVLFYGGDFEAMTNTSRVSAFWPGMAIVVLWAVDILLGFKRAKGIAVQVYRTVVHALVFVLFLGGSAIAGELTTVKMLGLALLLAAVIGPSVWLRDRMRGTSL